MHAKIVRFIYIAAHFGLLAAVPNAAFADDTAAQGEILFVRRIHPLLVEKCFACHGGDETAIQGGLDVRSRSSLLRGGETELPSVTPGKPDESPLILAIQRTDSEWGPMPPKDSEKLSQEQIEWFREWIAKGAPWPDRDRFMVIEKENADSWSQEDGIVIKTTGALTKEWANRRYKPNGLWAYRPVLKPDLPIAQTGQHPIDQFIQERLPSKLELAPSTDAKTLIRRATFDLIGLPPSHEEIQSFEEAYEKNEEGAVLDLVNRLLESPHYGERMAQHWLDVTRYADSSGFANDFERGNAWRYRDYVVRSFNSDKPYDRFIKEQIAGDEIDPHDPELLIAVGFLRMGPWELTGMEVPKVARQRFLDDVTNSVGETFLAHSLQCARCHDHKFDPIPTHDYYAIQAVFATTQLCEREAPFLPSENQEGFEERRYLEKGYADHQTTLAELDALMLENAQRWFKQQDKDPSVWNVAVASAQEANSKDKLLGKEGKVKRKDFSELFSAARNSLLAKGVPESEFPPKLVDLTPEQFGMERISRKGLERLKWEFERYEPFALSVYSGRTPDLKSVFNPRRIPKDAMNAGELEETSILIGGDPFAGGTRVRPGALSVMNSYAAPSIPETMEGRRKAFAAWIAHPSNSLTTRAIVNRIWMWHFGDPIAGNPNNFGSTGKEPTHPELLDWLAYTFVEQKWSFKSLHRSVMTSQAYRRSSTHPNPTELRACDPHGVSLAVFKPRRLSAEEMRDSMLKVTGELNPKVGGIPNRPEMNLEAAMQPRQVMGTFATAWVPNPKPHQRHRRSLYALKLRGLSDPSMEVLNAPSPDFSCERRESSVITPQVFSLFHSKSSHARAIALASRVMKEIQTDEAAIARCFVLALGRKPTVKEQAMCLSHWREIEATYGETESVSFQPPLEIRRDAIEENTGEKFTFSERLYGYADFEPDLGPSDVSAHTRALADVCLILFNTNEYAYVY